MKKYKPVYEKDIAIFLALYQKIAPSLQVAQFMSRIISDLPTDVIEYVFDGVKLVDDRVDLSQLDKATFGVGGLCGCQKIRVLVWNLEYLSYLQSRGTLAQRLAATGHKVNLKKTGPRKDGGNEKI